MQNANELLGVSEAARTLRVSEQTVRNLEKRGVLRGSRVSNGSRVFERKTVEAFALEWQRIKARS